MSVDDFMPLFDRRCRPWSEAEVAFLREQYPTMGLFATAEALGRPNSQVRSKASALGIKQDRNSEFFKEWQQRAAKSKIGKKRPGQAEVIRRMHAEGKFPPISEDRRQAISEAARRRIREKGHPRGALGMKHTLESRAAIGAKAKAFWESRTEEEKMAWKRKIAATRAANGIRPDPRGNWKAGWREIGGQRCYFRSRWEANYARFLEWRKQRGDIASWEHEPKTFFFDGVRRGVVSYLPDFKISLVDGREEYHEVKGWMDPRSKTKIKRMKKYHPTVVLVVVDSKSYRSLAKLVQSTIPEWE